MSAKQPLISVIVPIYNTSQWLRKCLDSICTQTYPNLQIIAIDDGSTDDSLSLLREYAEKDPRIEVVHQENAGLSAARNAGLSVAKGEYITGVDSDDYLHPNAYETLISQLNPEADIVCYGAQPVNENGKKVSLHIMDVLLQGIHCMTQEIANITSPTFQNKLWKHDLFRKWDLHFAPGLIHEDEILWRQAASVSNFIQFIPDRLYYYLQRSGSIMHSKKNVLKKTKDYCLVIENIAHFFQKHNRMEEWGNNLAHIMGAFYDSCLKLSNSRTEKLQVTHSFKQLLSYISFPPRAQSIYPIAELKQKTLFYRLFYKRSFNKTCYGLFGIPLWTVRTRKNKTTYRLIGIPVWQNNKKF